MRRSSLEVEAVDIGGELVSRMKWIELSMQQRIDYMYQNIEDLWYDFLQKIFQ